MNKKFIYEENLTLDFQNKEEAISFLKKIKETKTLKINGIKREIKNSKINNKTDRYQLTIFLEEKEVSVEV